MSRRSLHEENETKSGLAQCPLFSLLAMAGNNLAQKSESISILLPTAQLKISSGRQVWSRHLPPELVLQRSGGQVVLVQPFIESHAETLSCPAVIGLGRQLQNTKVLNGPSTTARTEQSLRPEGSHSRP